MFIECPIRSRTFSDLRDQNLVFADFVEQDDVSATSAIDGKFTAIGATEEKLTATGAAKGKLTTSGATEENLTAIGMTTEKLTASSATEEKLTAIGEKRPKKNVSKEFYAFEKNLLRKISLSLLSCTPDRGFDFMFRSARPKRPMF